jgi:hypothetical protein
MVRAPAARSLEPFTDRSNAQLGVMTVSWALGSLKDNIVDFKAA